MIMWASCSLKVQAANLKEKIPVELLELEKDISRLDGDLQRKREEKRKPDAAGIQKYFVEACTEDYGVSLNDALTDKSSCNLPWKIPSRAETQIRDDYNAYAQDMKDRFRNIDPDDEEAGYECSFGRSSHRISERIKMENIEMGSAESLRKRDCRCYGDPDGPCGQFVGYGNKPSRQFKACVDLLFKSKKLNAAKTCASAAKTNFAANMWCKAWGLIYWGTDFLIGEEELNHAQEDTLDYEGEDLSTCPRRHGGHHYDDDHDDHDDHYG